MRKRRWKQEYKCNKFGMKIIAKMTFCKEPYEKCEKCPLKEIKETV